MVLIAKHMQWRCQIPRPRYISIGDISFIAKVWIFGILLLLLSEGILFLITDSCDAYSGVDRTAEHRWA